MKTPFLGRGWSFPPTFQKSSKTVKMVEEVEDIEQSLTILLTTRKGERITLPDFGCNLHPSVFKKIDSSTETYLSALIADAILFYEPRIILDEVRFDKSNAIDGILRIDIHYTVRTTNNRRNLVFPYYFQEATLIP
jgi:phage baseplate assembly protein W